MDIEDTILMEQFKFIENLSKITPPTLYYSTFLVRPDVRNLRVKFICNILEYRHRYGCHCYPNFNSLTKRLLYFKF